MRYRVYGIAFDMEGLTEGDFEDFQRAVERLEADFPGTLVLGNDGTNHWPGFRVTETKCPCQLCSVTP